jgi:HEPN domain-containing protein
VKREGTPRDYLDAAAERFQEAKDLYRLERYGGATYLAGVSIECALNAFLPSGHQLRGVHSLAVLLADGLSQRLPAGRAKEMGTLLTEVCRRWSNSQRYYPSSLIERVVKPRVRDHRDAKGNAKYLVDSAYTMYAQAYTIWVNPDDFPNAKDKS